MSRRLLVTAALPYANGPIHLGHVVEYVQADIWVRFQRLRGHRCLFVCADDTHGTAMMIRARQAGRPETELLAEMSAEHQRDFRDLGVAFDHYGSTHSAANRSLCHEFWAAIRAAGLVEERRVTQLFDPREGTFLADRFVRGTCPRCGARDQYGDTCEKCGATYAPADLKDPVSVLSGAAPELREAPHLFVRIRDLQPFLEEFTQTPGRLQPEVANYLQGAFLGEPLWDWDVSRPAPYFGFEIPDAPGHYWYVWFDAPIGYVAATQEWCARHGEPLAAWWKDPATEIHHFLGKDIIYFHCLFWPAMLKLAGYALPHRLHVHGFLTVQGEKMSKSRGTFVTARRWLDHVDPAYLRYFYASKLGERVEDLDLSLDEFVAKVNSDLVGKVANLASRTARFVERSGLASAWPADGGLFAQGAAAGAEIAAAYEARDTARAMRLVMALADRANEFVERAEPWTLRKDPARAPDLQAACTVALNLFWQVSVYLAPVLPNLAAQAGRLLGRPIRRWEDAAEPCLGGAVAPFEHLMRRVERAQLEAVFGAADPPAPARPAAPVPPAAPAPEPPPAMETPDPYATEPLAPPCTLEDFAKVDLRVARVLEAEEVPEARKLLRLVLDLGGGVQRQVYAGIKAAYRPEALVGRLVVCVANLAPRTMKFGVSEGMVVAAGPGDTAVFLLAPDAGASPGQRVH